MSTDNRGSTVMLFFFFFVMAARILEDVQGETHWRQKDLKANAFLFGEWLYPAADYSLDNPFTKLATNQSRKESAAIGFHLEQRPSQMPRLVLF